MKHAWNGLRFAVAGSVVAFLSVVPIRAQVFTGTETLSDYGDLSQYNSAVTYTNTLNVQPVACAPTSFINALTYLNNVNGGSVFTHAPNTYADLNAMAAAMGTSYNTYYNATTLQPYNSGGTPYDSAALGSITYDLSTGFNPALTPVKIGGQFTYPATAGRGLGANFNNTAPSLSYLSDAINSNSAVELGIQWGSYSSTTGSFTPSGGLHVVDLSSLDVTNGAGNFGIVDPIPNDLIDDSPNAVADNFQAQVSTIKLNGTNFLYLTYPNSAYVGPEPQTGGLDGSGSGLYDFGTPSNSNGQTALIVADWVESVPEPSTGALLLAAAGLLLLRHGMRRTRSVL